MKYESFLSRIASYNRSNTGIVRDGNRLALRQYVVLKKHDTTYTVTSDYTFSAWIGRGGNLPEEREIWRALGQIFTEIKSDLLTEKEEYITAIDKQISFFRRPVLIKQMYVWVEA